MGRTERVAQRVEVVAVHRQHVPAPRAVFHRHILRVHLIDLGRELHVVGVVIHDEVRQSEVSGDAAHALRDLLLDAAVRNVGIGLVRHPLAEARRHEALGDRGAQRHGVTLAQRTRGVLHAAQHVRLGMTRRHAAPLAQRLEVVERVVSGQCQHRVEHRRHVARIEEQTVAEGVVHPPRIVAQEFRIEQSDEVGTAHRAARVARFRFLDHGRREDADVVGCTQQ